MKPKKFRSYPKDTGKVIRRSQVGEYQNYAIESSFWNSVEMY